MKTILFLLLLYYWRGVNAQSTTTTPLETESTAIPTINFNVTDIPQSDVDDALNLDIGKYTPQTFHYANFQNKQWNNRIYKRWNRATNYCYEQYTRCLMNLVAFMTVCTYHNNEYRDAEGYGFRTFPSYCDVFLNNCRRGLRYWRIMEYGECTNIGVRLPSG